MNKEEPLAFIGGVRLQPVGVTPRELFCCPNLGEKNPPSMGEMKP